jgi:hypothetical protein
MEKTIEALEAKVAELSKELDSRIAAENELRIETEIQRTWSGDLPADDDRLDYLKFLVKDRFQYNAKRGQLEDRLGVCRNLSEFKLEIETTNQVFKKAESTSRTGGKRRITQREFAVELPRDPQLKAAFLRGEVEVVD